MKYFFNTTHAARQSHAATRVDDQQTVRKFLRRIVQHHGRLALVATCCMAVSGLLNGVGLLLLIPMLHVIGLNSSDHSSSRLSDRLTALASDFGIPLNLASVLVAFVMLSTANALLTRWLSLTNARLKEDVVHSLRTELYAAVHRVSWLYFVSRQSSDFTHGLTDNLKRVSAGTLQALRLLSSLSIAVVQLAAALFIAPLLSLVAIGTATVLWPLLGSQNRRVSRESRRLTTINREFFGHLANHLGGMKESRSLGAESQNIDDFDRRSDEIRQSHIELTHAMARTAVVYSIGGAVLLSSLLYFARAVLNTPAASMIALVIVFSRIFPRLRDIHSGSLYVLQMLPAFGATLTLIEECGKHQEAVSNVSEPIRLSQQIEFKNVRFSYSPSADGPTLQNVSLNITAGQVTAIVGPSGAGKSTLADLMLTLIRPDEGDILIDGRSLSESDGHAWRQSIGYVPQETYLFHGSIKANLLWSKPEASETELWAALRAAAALEFVAELPNGIETVVGDRGVRFSGGERQRISLARALLRAPSLLILDEATSALDAENQQRIKDAVQKLKGKLTVVTVAHRLSTVCDADQIIVLDGGHVIESGAYSQLANQPGSRLRSLILAELPAARAA